MNACDPLCAIVAADDGAIPDRLYEALGLFFQLSHPTCPTPVSDCESDAFSDYEDEYWSELFVSCIQSSPSALSCQKYKSRLNPDGHLLGLHSTGADVTIDVCVTNPTAQPCVPAFSGQKLFAARAEEMAKTRTVISLQQPIFCPFVAESGSYGAFDFGMVMKVVIGMVARRADERKVVSAFHLQTFNFRSWACRRRVLSAAIQRIQRGNSKLWHWKRTDG